MPFRLELELKSRAARALWTRSIAAFYTIADNFKIDIRQGTESGIDEFGRNCYNEIVFTSTNKTRTTVMSISFKEVFFKKFKIDGEISSRVNSVGNKNVKQTNYAKSYTMIVGSQDMNILFKDCAEDAVSWKIFMLAGDEVTHMIYSNKIFVEFDTKSGMKKKYSVSYRPSSLSYDNRIHYLYLKFLENQKRLDDGELGDKLGKDGEEDDGDDFGMFDEDNDDEDDERIHRIAMDTNIFKRFLQMFPLKLEDMKIEVDGNDGTIAFRGYNRQQIVLKDDTIFKKPMTLGIKMRLSTTIYNNVKEGELSKKMHVSFRLKNFKTFIQVINFNYSDFKEYSDEDKDSYAGGRGHKNQVMPISEEGGNVCDIMFSKPGLPIIFERRYFLDEEHDITECCSVTLTEVTDGDSKKLLLDHGINGGIENRVIDLGKPTMKVNLRKRKRDLLDEPAREEARPDNVEGDNGEPLFVPDEYEAPEEIDKIFWNNEKFHRSTIVPKSGTQVEEGEDDDEDDNEEGDGYLGPTQKEQIKGIFD